MMAMLTFSYLTIGYSQQLWNLFQILLMVTSVDFRIPSMTCHSNSLNSNIINSSHPNRSQCSKCHSKSLLERAVTRHPTRGTGEWFEKLSFEEAAAAATAVESTPFIIHSDLLPARTMLPNPHCNNLPCRYPAAISRTWRSSLLWSKTLVYYLQFFSN